MASRYDGRRVATNDSEMYRSLFKKRGVRFIRQYVTPQFRYPTAEEMADVQEVGVIWSTGDRLWKLSQKYYGLPEYWWVIAFWNQTHEMHITTGQTIYVPLPIDRVLGIIKV